MKHLFVVGLLGVAMALPGCGASRDDQARVSTQTETPRTGILGRVLGKRADTGAVVGGGLCGDPALVGEVVGAVPGEIRGCGIENAVRLRSVSDVPLSQAALVDCSTARALRTWVDGSLKPEVGKRGGGVAQIKVAAHYACRTRNHQPGAKISEHGRGRAIDISGITLADGSTVTVLDGWGTQRDGKLLNRLHKAACGPFGTVLGPKSDRFHQDHFHFDTASYRSGSYCR